MKKITVVLILAVVLMFSSCSNKQENPETSDSGVSANIQTIAPAKENTKLSESISTTDAADNTTVLSEVNTTEKSSKTDTKTVKTTEKTSYKKPQKTTELIYEMRIGYKSLEKLKTAVLSYKTFNDLMKSVNADRNNDCVNPFRQENLTMIFEDKKAFTPILPKGYKIKSASLCSRSFFEFIFSEDDEEDSLLIYTSIDLSAKDKLKRSFESDQGTVIYKNSNKQYCWLLDDKYLVVYSGDDKDFINELYFEAIYIN